MQTIFVQVKCELGRAYDVADAAVQNSEQVSEVHSTSGQYDLLMKCYLPDGLDIGHFVTNQIQTLPGVRDTFTLRLQGLHLNRDAMSPRRDDAAAHPC